MAIRIPTTSLRLETRHFRRGHSILSGDGAVSGVEARGIRGLNSEVNHLMAYRGPTLLDDADWLDTGIVSGTSAAGETCITETRRTVPVGFSELEITAEVEDGGIQITVDGTASGYTTTAAGRTMHTISVAVTPGLVRISVECKKDVAAFYVLHAYEIYPVVMVSGDFT